MAISRCRAPARASNRLATLAHAISSTSVTAPSRIQRLKRTSRTRNSRMPQMRRLRPPAAKNGGFTRGAIAFISACARAMEMPGFNRARPRS